MESMERLRELADDMNCYEIIDHVHTRPRFMLDGEWLDSWHKAFDKTCADIEAEIAEKYMELPLDADGVPIKVGDMIQFVNEYGGTGSKVEVCAVSNYYAYYGEGKHFYNVKYCRHVSRTLEDVLEDFIKTYDRWDEKGIDEDERTALFSEYATEIRDLLGVSDDSR